MGSIPGPLWVAKENIIRLRKVIQEQTLKRAMFTGKSPKVTDYALQTTN